MDESGCLGIVGRMANFERFKVYGDVVYAQAIERAMKEMSSIEHVIVVGKPSGGASGHELAYCVQ